MHTLIYSLLVMSMPAMTEGGDFSVVVHTTDRVVINYYCGEFDPNSAINHILRHEVRAEGGATWHVQGGVAPYTILRNELDKVGAGCISVMDAEGRTATSCGVIGERVENVQVPCLWYQQDTLNQAPVMAPGKDTGSQGISDHSAAKPATGQPLPKPGTVTKRVKKSRVQQTAPSPGPKPQAVQGVDGTRESPNPAPPAAPPSPKAVPVTAPRK